MIGTLVRVSPERSPLVVSRLAEAEWSLLRELRLAALVDNPTAFASTYEREADFSEATWRHRLQGDNPAFVARSGREVAGLAGGYRDEDGDELHLVSMWVAPAWRRAGVASQLVGVVAAWAAQRGAARLHLWVTVDNHAGRRCYDRNGFVATGRTQPLPSNPALDELEMALDLPR